MDKNPKALTMKFFITKEGPNEGDYELNYELKNL